MTTNNRQVGYLRDVRGGLVLSSTAYPLVVAKFLAGTRTVVGTLAEDLRVEDLSDCLSTGAPKKLESTVDLLCIWDEQVLVFGELLVSGVALGGV